MNKKRKKRTYSLEEIVGKAREVRTIKHQRGRAVSLAFLEKSADGRASLLFETPASKNEVRTGRPRPRAITLLRRRPARVGTLINLSRPALLALKHLLNGAIK